MDANSRVRTLAWTGALIALAATLTGEFTPSSEGSATSASGYTQGSVTLYEGEVTAFNVTTDPAELTLNTGAPQIYLSHFYGWNALPPIAVGDHVRVWTFCSNICGSSTTEALKVISPHATSVSDTAQFHDVDFTPQSGAVQSFRRIAGPVAGVVLGLIVFFILLLSEPTPLVALSVAGAMIAVGLAPITSKLNEVNGLLPLIAPTAGLAALVSGLLARQFTKRRKLPTSPFAILGAAVGGFVVVAVPVVALVFRELSDIANGLG
jgi:hypothetical protein